MINDEYAQEVELACKELVQEGKNPVRAGEIAETAGIDDSSKLGMQLTFGVIEFDDIEYEVIRHEDESVSNEYRIRR
ncbi:hypothetical protein [Halorubrum tibetense]|uniref:Transcriptional regulator n=1 Tax=Halorubrum tibetense TaxID=175631 RepID=A0ABD5S6F0_9EURY